MQDLHAPHLSRDQISAIYRCSEALAPCGATELALALTTASGRVTLQLRYHQGTVRVAASPDHAASRAILGDLVAYSLFFAHEEPVHAEEGAP